MTSRLEGADEAGRNSELRLFRGRRLEEVVGGRQVDRVLLVSRERVDGAALFLVASGLGAL